MNRKAVSENLHMRIFKDCFLFGVIYQMKNRYRIKLLFITV